jgi:hypothetical protein
MKNEKGWDATYSIFVRNRTSMSFCVTRRTHKQIELLIATDCGAGIIKT